MKDLSIVFFNSIEEMNECYGTSVDIPHELHSNADFICYEIVEPFVYEYLGQYVFTKVGFHHLDNLGNPVIHNHNGIKSELSIYEDDVYEHEGSCFVYVRVNEYLRKHIKKTLIGCEFVCKNGIKCMSDRRFVESMGKNNLVYDQDGFCTPLKNILLYTDDHSDPIPYKEWVKKIA